MQNSLSWSSLVYLVVDKLWYDVEVEAVVDRLWYDVVAVVDGLWYDVVAVFYQDGLMCYLIAVLVSPDTCFVHAVLVVYMQVH